MFRKTVSILLASVILLSILTIIPITVHAETSGTTGDCTWHLDGTTLKISGSGSMADYTYEYDKRRGNNFTTAPWGTAVKDVSIEYGVSSIGNCSFYGCDIETISISDSVISIGESAFAHCWSLHSIDIPNSVSNISSYAFDGAYIYHIDLPDRISSINQVGYFLLDGIIYCLSFDYMINLT